MQRSSGTGTPREQLVNTHFPDYVTEPEQIRNGYQQVLARGVVTDLLLTNRRLTEFQAKMSSWVFGELQPERYRTLRRPWCDPMIGRRGW